MEGTEKESLTFNYIRFRNFQVQETNTGIRTRSSSIFLGCDGWTTLNRARVQKNENRVRGFHPTLHTGGGVRIRIAHLRDCVVKKLAQVVASKCDEHIRRQAFQDPLFTDDF